MLDPVVREPEPSTDQSSELVFEIGRFEGSRLWAIVSGCMAESKTNSED